MSCTDIKSTIYSFWFLLKLQIRSCSKFVTHATNIWSSGDGSCDVFFKLTCRKETLLQNFVKLGVKLTFFAPWLPWQRPPFWILQRTVLCSSSQHFFLLGCYQEYSVNDVCKTTLFGIGRTNFAAVAMEIKKEGFFKKIWFLSSNIVVIFTVVCGSFWCVDKIQNDVTMETKVPK
jgi:hypothetical protein